MKELINLVEVVTKHDLKKIEYVPDAAADEGHFAHVMSGIMDHSIKSEADMAGKIGFPEGSAAFRTFKSRFKDKLINMLLFLDLSRKEVSNYGKAGFACSRHQHAVKILLFLHARTAAMDIVRHMHVKAATYELYESAAFCARRLRTHYSLLGDVKKFNLYNKQYHEYREKHEAETDMEEYLERAYALVANVTAPTREILETIGADMKAAEALRKKYDTYQTGLNYYRLCYTWHFLRRDYTAAIHTCKQYWKHIEKYQDYEFRTRMGEVSLHFLECYLHKRNYKAGAHFALKSEGYFKIYSTHWFVCKEYVFLFLMQSGDYVKAGETIEKVKSDRHFKNQPENRIERWQLFEAYYFLVVRSKMYKVSKGLTHFKPGNLLLLAPIHAEDKLGYNIAIFILQIIWTLIDKDYKMVAIRVNDLINYMEAHMGEDEEYLSRPFLEMLINADDCNYKKEKTREATAFHRAKLFENEARPVTARDGLEIVPYSVLWKIVENSLI